MLATFPKPMRDMLLVLYHCEQHIKQTLSDCTHSPRELLEEQFPVLMETLNTPIIGSTAILNTAPAVLSLFDKRCPLLDQSFYLPEGMPPEVTGITFFTTVLSQLLLRDHLNELTYPEMNLTIRLKTHWMLSLAKEHYPAAFQQLCDWADESVKYIETHPATDQYVSAIYDKFTLMLTTIAKLRSAPRPDCPNDITPQTETL